MERPPVTVTRKGKVTGRTEQLPGDARSYASAPLHLSRTIYDLARIMELDGSVGKTPINLIRLLFCFPAFLSNPLCLLWHPVCLTTSYVEVFSSRPLSRVRRFLLSRISGQRCTRAHMHCPANRGLQSANTVLDLVLLKWKCPHPQNCLALSYSFQDTKKSIIKIFLTYQKQIGFLHFNGSW